MPAVAILGFAAARADLAAQEVGRVEDGRAADRRGVPLLARPRGGRGLGRAGRFGEGREGDGRRGRGAFALGVEDVECHRVFGGGLQAFQQERAAEGLRGGADHDVAVLGGVVRVDDGVDFRTRGAGAEVGRLEEERGRARRRGVEAVDKERRRRGVRHLFFGQQERRRPAEQLRFVVRTDDVVAHVGRRGRDGAGEREGAPLPRGEGADLDGRAAVGEPGREVVLVVRRAEDGIGLRRRPDAAAVEARGERRAVERAVADREAVEIRGGVAGFGRARAFDLDLP